MTYFLDPDVGVDDDIAQFYFMQLISAMVASNSCDNLKVLDILSQQGSRS